MALEDFTVDCGSGISASIASTLATFSRDIETEKLGEVRKWPQCQPFRVNKINNLQVDETSGFANSLEESGTNEFLEKVFQGSPKC